MLDTLAHLATTNVTTGEVWRHTERLRQEMQSNLTLCHQEDYCNHGERCTFVHCAEVEHEAIDVVKAIVAKGLF